jgi:hypothetical protein
MTPRTNRRIRLLAIAATPLVALASIGYASAAGASTDDIARLLVVVASFLITGFVAWTNRPENRMGRLMVALGLSLLVSMFAQPVWPLVVPIGLAFFVLASTLALWRGSPFANVGDDGALRLEADRLEELHLLALEERTEADLALGAGVELVDELESLVRQHPCRERLWGQLMLALYRAQRQATRWQPTAERGGFWTRNSASSRARSSNGWSRRFSGRMSLSFSRPKSATTLGKAPPPASGGAPPPAAPQQDAGSTKVIGNI